MKENQLELPYPIGPMVLESVLTKEAVKKLGLKKVDVLKIILDSIDNGNPY